MSPLVPISNEGTRFGEKFITLDAHQRLCLSSALRKELNIDGVPAWIVLAYDIENHRIGIVKQELAKVPNVKAFKVDQRGYTSAKYVIDKAKIDVATLPLRYVDAGFVDLNGQRWRTFELQKPDSSPQPL